MRASIGLVAALLGLLLVAGSPRIGHGATIEGDPPCGNSVQPVCGGFTGPRSGALNGIGFSPFRATRAGTALVSVSGSLVCGLGRSTVPRVVDVLSAIRFAKVTNGVFVPETTAPVTFSSHGVLRNATVLTASTAGTSNTFNIGTQRVITIPGPGDYAFSLGLNALRVDTGTACYAYTIAFSVVFVP